MPKWCVESYPSSLYKFEKTRFWHFVTISGRGQGGPNPCLLQLHFLDRRYTYTGQGYITNGENTLAQKSMWNQSDEHQDKRMSPAHVIEIPNVDVSTSQ